MFFVLTLVLSWGAPVYSITEDLSGQIVILHTNDGHGRAAEGTFGISGVSAIRKDLEQKGAAVLVLDAGDTIHGLPFATLDKGKSVARLMEAAGYLAMTPGNHDFNYGTDYLREFRQEAGFAVLSANVLDQTTGKPLFDPYLITEAAGKRVGIFGLTTVSTTTQTNPQNVEGLLFADPTETARKMVKVLKEEGADYIVALGHIGVEESMPDTSCEIIQAVEGIDIFIDGHSHTEFPQGKWVGQTLLASSGEYYHQVGLVTIASDGTLSARLLSLAEGQEAPKDPEIEGRIAEIQAEQAPLLKEVVGYTAVDLDGARETNRRQETNLGNLSADAVLWATGADLAVINGGGIRETIPAGEITRGQIISVFPFGNYAVTKQITGQGIREMLEHSVRYAPALTGGFLQVSGLRFSYDPQKPAGQRVGEILIQDKPIQETKTYTLATNDYLAAGGDEYAVLAACPEINEFNSMEEILIAYLQEQPAAAPQREGRISICAGKEEPDFYLIKEGDMLWKIAEKLLGDASAWQKLYEWNQEVVKDPNLIYPGQILEIKAA